MGRLPSASSRRLFFILIPSHTITQPTLFLFFPFLCGGAWLHDVIAELIQNYIADLVKHGVHDLFATWHWGKNFALPWRQDTNSKFI